MPSDFGRNLLRERKARGWSQEHLGALSSTGQTYIAGLETGRLQKPGVIEARNIERALGLPPYSLLAPAPKRRSKSA